MPSPIAHGLIGSVLGVACCLPRCVAWRQLWARVWRWRGLLCMCVVLANAPDIDCLFGMIWASGNLNAWHQMATHTLGWAVVAAGAVWLAQRWFPARMVRMSLGLIFLLLASHLLADYFGHDTSPPRGIMLFWPLDTQYYISPWPLFPAPHKINLAGLWSAHNVRVVLLELAVLLPGAWAVLWWKTRREPRNPRA